MATDTTLITKKPSQCSDDELGQFVTLVESEGEVIGGLLNRVKKRGETLIFLYQSNILAGVAAIKRPYGNYRSDVFKKAKSPFQPEDFSFELGWIVVSPDFRRKRFAKRLFCKLMMEIGKKNIFATTRENNATIRRYLESHNFILSGEPYPSKNPDEKLVLFTRQ